MKATMSANGVLEISPESSIEVFAMTQWLGKSVVPMRDEKLNESHFVRGSTLVVLFTNPDLDLSK